jgi:hypothetical protein
MYAIHRDPYYYETPNMYDAFRFLKMRQNAGGDQQRSFSLTSTSNSQYIAFGLPLNAWYVQKRHLKVLKSDYPQVPDDSLRP